MGTCDHCLRAIDAGRRSSILKVFPFQLSLVFTLHCPYYYFIIFKIIHVSHCNKFFNFQNYIRKQYLTNYLEVDFKKFFSKLPEAEEKFLKLTFRNVKFLLHGFHHKKLKLFPNCKLTLLFKQTHVILNLFYF